MGHFVLSTSFKERNVVCSEKIIGSLTNKKQDARFQITGILYSL